jgi:hypothetical protein
VLNVAELGVECEFVAWVLAAVVERVAPCGERA